MDVQEGLKVTEAFLSKRCTQDYTWLLEDREFVCSIIIGLNCVIERDGFITWLAAFMESLDLDYLAKKVTAIRIKEILKEKDY
jgi:hypothetical protein